MSYEYKDEILDDIGPEPNSIAQKDSDNYHNKINELNEVYHQAEAYKKIKKAFKQSVFLSEFELKVRTIIDSTESEAE